MKPNIYEPHCIRFYNTDLLMPPTEKRTYRKLLHAFMGCVRLCRELETAENDYYPFHFRFQIESFDFMPDHECYLYLLAIQIAGQQSYFMIDMDNIYSVDCYRNKQGNQSFALRMKNGMELILQ